MKNVSLQKALAQLQQRRVQNEIDLSRREMETAQRCPEVLAIRRELAGTAVKLSKLVLSAPDNMAEILKDMSEKSLALQRREKELLRQAGYPEDYLEKRFYCDKCRDTGYLGQARCSCLNELIGQIGAEELQKNSMLAPMSFADFSLSYYSAEADLEHKVIPRQIMGEILDFCQKYARDFSPGVKGILMQGETGLGKTHLSLAIAGEAAKKGFSVSYDSAQNLLRVIEGEHFGRLDNQNTLDTVLNVDLLVLDDLGTEFASQFTLSMIYDILNTRLSRGMTTIVNTNLSARELEEKYSRRIVSRLYSCLTCLRFVGKDVRQQRSRNG